MHEVVILFDLDGTVIDSTQAILESFHNSFDHYGVTHPSDEAIKALIGHPLDDMYKTLGIAEDDIWDYVNTYKQYYRGIACAKTTLLPQAIEAIKEAATFARLGIVTTKTGKYSQELMEHFDLMHYFETLVGREHVVEPKPHAEPILKALKNMGVTHNNVWIIGDTHLDIESSKNAGIKHVAVTSGYETKEQLQQYTKVIVDNVLQAVKRIKGATDE